VVPGVERGLVAGAGRGLAEEEVVWIEGVQCCQVKFDVFHDHFAGVSGQGDQSLAMFFAGVELESSFMPSNGADDVEGFGA